MISLTRRDVVLGGALTLLWGTSSSFPVHACSRAASCFGCTLADDDVDAIYPNDQNNELSFTGNEPIIPRSSDRDFDLALAQTLAKISDLFGVIPGFAYYDDYDGLNAYATPRPRLNRPDGTVLFGQRLLRRLLNSPESPDACVAAVCAHEFGHIVQYKYGLVGRLRQGQTTAKRIELQADYFAGYFAGIRKRANPSFPAAVFAMTQYNFGDNMVNHPSHHGTPEERGAAIVRGFETAYRSNGNFQDALQSSTNYVTRL